MSDMGSGACTAAPHYSGASSKDDLGNITVDKRE